MGRASVLPDICCTLLASPNWLFIGRISIYIVELTLSHYPCRVVVGRVQEERHAR
jgi:hypothetical protein